VGTYNPYGGGTQSGRTDKMLVHLLRRPVGPIYRFNGTGEGWYIFSLHFANMPIPAPFLSN
jgi:hypothetical protein